MQHLGKPFGTAHQTSGEKVGPEPTTGFWVEADNVKRTSSRSFCASARLLLRWSLMGERIGTAGWSIARKDAAAFPADGTALERYSRVFNGVEVNSSFHRSHRPSTWEKWAQSVPEEFRFAVKLPKTITHQAKLVDVDLLVTRFADEVRQLGGKLAVVLVQLPPKLAFDAALIDRFFATLRNALDAEIACEPRNCTWFDDDADEMLRHLRVARVAADPIVALAAGSPGGWRGLPYWRLHGSPKM